METSNNRVVSLQDLLKERNSDFDNAAKTSAKAIMLVRHADSRVTSKEFKIGGKSIPNGIANMYELYLYYRELFDMYQSEQKKGTFKRAKYIVSFIGETSTTARFIGVYEVMGRHQSPFSENDDILDLRPVSEFQFLKEKIVIDWGKNTVAWYQYYDQKKEVIRIEERKTRADGIPIFKSYLDVTLNYDQLKLVLKDDEWVKKLKVLNCIYLIADKSNGKHYVGSTYRNRKGIFGRWTEYAETGHGGNVELEKIIRQDPQYHVRNFQWTILETLPLNITGYEAIERENVWKKKLLSREWGYNNN